MNPLKGIRYKYRFPESGDMFITWEGTDFQYPRRPNLALVTYIERWPKGGGKMRYVYWDFVHHRIQERESSGAIDRNRIVLSLTGKIR